MSTKPGKTITMTIVGIIALVPMKKSKALIVAILTTMWAIAAPFSPYPMMALVCAAAALLFGGIWYCKRLRDHTRARHAAAQWQLSPSNQPNQNHQITQTVTTKRRDGLFVPPPLD